MNKDFKKILSEHAELKAISLEDVRTASDGTRKVAIAIASCTLVLYVIIFLYLWQFVPVVHIDCGSCIIFSLILKLTGTCRFYLGWMINW